MNREDEETPRARRLDLRPKSLLVADASFRFEGDGGQRRRKREIRFEGDGG